MKNILPLLLLSILIISTINVQAEEKIKKTESFEMPVAFESISDTTKISVTTYGTDDDPEGPGSGGTIPPGADSTTTTLNSSDSKEKSWIDLIIEFLKL